jgi:hypothetical protein
MMAKDVTIFCGDKSCKWRDFALTFNKLKYVINHIRIEHYRHIAAVLASPGGIIIMQKMEWKKQPLPLMHLLKQYRY